MVGRFRIRIIVMIALAALFILPAAGAYAGGYLEWSDAPQPANGSSPHGGYTSATTKCKVCHAVHQAQMGGEVLMRSTTADACLYCHVGGPIAYTQVYNGNPALYSGTDYLNAHNWVEASAKSVTKCTLCHQVHGATSYMTANEALTQRILVKFNSWGPAGAPASGESTETALTKWCDGCHVSLAGELGGARWDNTYGDYTHIMGPAKAVYGGAGSYKGQVAWKDSTYCTSCHARGFNGEPGGSFPHYTDGIYFLAEATSSVAATAAAGNAEQDGVCVRCHNNGTGGIGIDF